MSEALNQIVAWAGHLGDRPLLLAGIIVVVLVAFRYLSNWKPKSARDAENRLREIREESHDYYRHLRPPGR
jgi:hypothetical protein